MGFLVWEIYGFYTFYMGFYMVILGDIHGAHTHHVHICCAHMLTHMYIFDHICPLYNNDQ